LQNELNKRQGFDIYEWRETYLVDRENIDQTHKWASFLKNYLNLDFLRSLDDKLEKQVYDYLNCIISFEEEFRKNEIGEEKLKLEEIEQKNLQ